jgi:hypothetical protein
LADNSTVEFRGPWNNFDGYYVEYCLDPTEVSRDSFTFKARLNDQMEGFSGEYAGDQLKIWLDRQGRESAIVLTRVKRAAPHR